MPILSSNNRRHRSKIGGCLGSFSHLFDWNRILGNKSVASAKLLQQDFENSPVHINFKNPLFQEVGREVTSLPKSKSSKLKQLGGEIERIQASSYPSTSFDLEAKDMEMHRLHDMLNMQEEPFLLESLLQQKKQVLNSQLRDTKIRLSMKGKEKNIQQARRSLNLKKIKMNETKKTHRSVPQSKSLSTSRQASPASPLQFPPKLLMSPTKSPSRISSPARSPIHSPARRAALLIEAAAKILDPNSHSRKCLPTVRSLLLETEGEPTMVVNDRKEEILYSVPQRSLETLDEQNEVWYSQKQPVYPGSPSCTIPNKPQHSQGLFYNLEEHRHEKDCNSQTRIFPERLGVEGSSSVSHYQSKLGVKVPNHEKEGAFAWYGKLFGSVKVQKKDESQAVEQNSLRYLFWRRATYEASAAWIMPGSTGRQKGKLDFLSYMGSITKLLPRRKEFRKHTLGKDLQVNESKGCPLQSSTRAKDADIRSFDISESENNRDSFSLGLSSVTDTRDAFLLIEPGSQLVKDSIPSARMQLDSEQSEVSQVIHTTEEPAMSNVATEEKMHTVMAATIIDNDAPAMDIERKEISCVSVETESIIECRCKKELQSQQPFDNSILLTSKACPLLLCDFSWWKKEGILETEESMKDPISEDDQISEDVSSQQWTGSPHHVNNDFQIGKAASLSEAQSSASAVHACSNNFEQSSPVSVLEASFEEESPALEKSLDSFEEVKQKFLEKVQKYELLAKMDLSLLEKYVNEQQEILSVTTSGSSSSNSPVTRHGIHYDDDTEDEEADKSLKEEAPDEISNEALSVKPLEEGEPQSNEPLFSGFLSQIQSCQSSNLGSHFPEARGHRLGPALAVDCIGEELDSVAKQQLMDSSYIQEPYLKSAIQRRQVIRQKVFPVCRWQLERVDNLLEKEIPSGRSHWRDIAKGVDEIRLEIHANLSRLLLHELLAEFVAEIEDSVRRG